MRIQQAEFVTSAMRREQLPREELPEIALVGRSNVGKSSLINKICNRTGLARVSRHPGRTRTINFYRINRAFFLVDLPGYGFARVSDQMKRQWAGTIESYLKNRSVLRAVLHIVDIRHPPTEDDVQMYHWLKHYNYSTLIVATKADKISKGKWPQYISQIRRILVVKEEDKIIPFSAKTGQGKQEILRELAKYAGLPH
ncbi:ribosome biogenesis GTP-binding protein YihA/YsxC [Calderihabitans maritimus]|uniref:Probable GTP-binding protein EngB n=1 Tax=Calderihabitans maritimus TaxID=1246530 RepID=A0A1Z5HUU4_9FIRM|nr:ribosome biogenesis GTP-binding protein YihA/YsxC [Calderihabitans maritimus]GAW93309.1 GTP-binding protein YsxC [Calderihabitans maritimus]